MGRRVAITATLAALWVASSVVAVADEAADVGDDARATERIVRLKADRPFWSWIAAPHQREVREILAKVEQNRQLARNMNSFNYQGAFLPDMHREKRRALADAAGMLRYALTLSPKNREALQTLAQVQDALGRTAQSIATYERLLALTPATREADPAFHAALGVLYARQQLWNKAADHLETGSIKAHGAAAGALSYALVEMERGNLETAIDFLVNIPNTDGTYLGLALAVAYDRNDEESKASAALGRLKRSHAMSAAMSPPWGLDRLPFAPTYDVHYFRALLYETSGDFADARSEWLAYLRAAPDARYREKAARHIRDIDALARTRRPRTQTPATGNPTPPIFRPSHP